MEAFIKGFLAGTGFYIVNYLVKNLLNRKGIISKYLGLHYEIKYSAIIYKNEEMITPNILTTLPDNSLSLLMLLDEDYNEYTFFIKKKNSNCLLYNCEENSKCSFVVSILSNDIVIKNMTNEETILCVLLKQIN